MKKEIIVGTFLLAILIVAGFYWYELRPSNIKKTCVEKAVTEAEGKGYSLNEVTQFYNLCLHKRGI